MSFISISSLNKNFGNFHAVSDVSLEFERHEFITLLGPSGCGKTTTLRLLAGFLQPSSGTITVNGKVVSSASEVVPPELRNMGMVFQSYAVWPHMSVFENVAFGLQLQKLDKATVKKRVDAMLEIVGLEKMADRFPNQLSGGQQQRVALARSLVMQPSILLLDEPLSNLDAKLRERMRAELKDVQKRMGINFIYVTHDQQEAMSLSDKVAVFDKGRVQQFGTPDEIYRSPANLFVAEFMGLINQIPMELLSSEGSRAKVSALGTVLEARFGRAPKSGGKAVLVVRPEAIRLAEGAAESSSNTFSGQIVDRVYYGNIVEYTISVSGHLLRAQCHPSVELKQGAMVAASMAPSDAIVMNS